MYHGCEHQCIYCDSRSECYGAAAPNAHALEGVFQESCQRFGLKTVVQRYQPAQQLSLW